ncbi:MAG TPA: DUF1631 family protein, partial [Burkholderiaceae bacterium]|nr:DUF1631 family protein [Burkholderiaceae bacterium]
REIQQACHQLFATAMNEVLKAFHYAVGDALLEAAELAVGTAQRARFSDAVRRIEQDRPGITERFGAPSRDTLRDPTAPRTAVGAAAAPAELSLVDDDQFEEWLSLSTVAHQIESDHSLVLARLLERYGALRGRSLDRATLPFGPASIGRAFQDALAPLDPPTPVRTIAYRTFGAALRARCAGLYGSLDEALAPLEAPKATPRRPDRPPAPARAAPSRQERRRGAPPDPPACPVGPIRPIRSRRASPSWPKRSRRCTGRSRAGRRRRRSTTASSA